MIQRGLKNLFICLLFMQILNVYNTVKMENNVLSFILVILFAIIAGFIWSFLLSGAEFIFTSNNYKKNYWIKYNEKVFKKRSWINKYILLIISFFILIIILSSLIILSNIFGKNTPNILLIIATINAVILTFIRDFVYLKSNPNFFIRMLFFNIFIKSEVNNV